MYREEQVISGMKANSAAPTTWSPLTNETCGRECYQSCSRWKVPCPFVTELVGADRKILLCYFDKQADRQADRQTAADPVARRTRCVSEALEGPELIFIRRDRLKPHLPCHAVDPGMERLAMG